MKRIVLDRIGKVYISTIQRDDGIYETVVFGAGIQKPKHYDSQVAAEEGHKVMLKELVVEP